MAPRVLVLLSGLLVGVAVGVAAAAEVCPLECCPQADCDCVQSVTCSDRGLTAVPSGTYESVQAIDLDNNDIEALGSLSGFPKLRQIFLSNNHLTMLDLEQFNGTDISSIIAPNNLVEFIYRLPYNMALPQLQVLHLQRNRIDKLSDSDLFGVTALRRLALDMNPLNALPPSAVDGHFVRGAEISFSNTPLACACAYGALKTWADGAGVTLNAPCAGSAPCAQLTN